MSNISRKWAAEIVSRTICGWMTVCLALIFIPRVFGQMDQGGIRGMIQDSSGAVVRGADVTLTSVETGLVLRTKSNDDGLYIFYPIKIGHYVIRVDAPGFQTTIQKNIQVTVQSTIQVPIVLQVGSASETVTVTTAPPVIQTDSATVGQVLTTEQIKNTPLNGGNWVYIVQLAPGVAPGDGSRGAGTGDFEANGQRPEQNDFTLDGIDNNSNMVDYLNGSTYIVRPPPDALAEFKVSTADYSAEYGHSAGALVNASIKEGTNHLHGDLWEFVRNDFFDAQDWETKSIPEYRDNQFGATLGFPIIKNKLFFFGDTQNTRIVFGQNFISTVPTALMRAGNFSELLNTSLTGSAQPIYLYTPNSGGSTLLQYNGQQNVFAPNQIDTVAQNILTLYPSPNTNGGKTVNNLVENLNTIDNTFQWDMRVDWNIRPSDQAFVRYSYTNEPAFQPAPLGPILDGTTARSGGTTYNLGENFALSETHIFTPTWVNEFRFGYNFSSLDVLQLNYNTNVGATLGMGGLPFGTGWPDNGGLPYTQISSISGFGSRDYRPSPEGQNEYQIMDNVTTTHGKHTIHMGVSFQAIRVRVLQPTFSHGYYDYTGTFTSNRGKSYTGYGVADFLANQMYSASLTAMSEIQDARWYRAAYIQDDWKITPKLMLNLGVRYDYYQPTKEEAGRQASFTPTGPFSVGHGTANYLLPTASKSVALSSAFTNALASNNITLQYTDNEALVRAQKTNFGPRVGFSYQLDNKSVLRAGYGIFYGALDSAGGSNNLGQSYPFEFTDSFVSPSCGTTSCLGNGITLENGFTTYLNAGLANFAATPSLYGIEPIMHTPYTMNYNFSLERTLTPNMSATLAYVGALGRHIDTWVDANPGMALVNPSLSIQTVRSFPGFNGGTNYLYNGGISSYNALQATLSKHFSRGMTFLSSFTWGRSLDDSPGTLGYSGDGGYRDTGLVPIRLDYSRSPFDVNKRFTFNGFYELPFGPGKKFLNGQGKAMNLIIGGWQTDLSFAAQTGFPFSVKPNISTAVGADNYFAIPIRNVFAPGGSPDPTNPGVTCATQTKTRAHWYNPCAFANPLTGSTIPVGTQISALSQVLQYLGGKRDQVPGPGYERINMSLFKNFTVYREQSLQLRADVFNLFNTPSLGEPSVTTDNSNGGAITSPMTFQNYTPDARFFQLAMKYTF